MYCFQKGQKGNGRRKAGYDTLTKGGDWSYKGGESQWTKGGDWGAKDKESKDARPKGRARGGEVSDLRAIAAANGAILRQERTLRCFQERGRPRCGTKLSNEAVGRKSSRHYLCGRRRHADAEPRMEISTSEDKRGKLLRAEDAGDGCVQASDSI